MSLNNKWIKNIVALLVGVTISFAALEVGIRILSSFLDISPYMQYDSEIGWIAKPNSTKIHKHPKFGFDVVYKINEKGFRGRQYPLEKPSNVYRIVILGDSNGFGWGNNEEDHFAALVDNMYKNVQVINLSLSGYGTDQAFLRFMRDGLQYNPDLVVVQVTPNDFEEIQFPFYNRKPKPHFVLNEKEKLVLQNVPVQVAGNAAKRYYDKLFPLPYKEWLIWNSYAYFFVNQKYLPIRKKYFKSDVIYEKREIIRYSPKSIKLFKSIISKLKHELDVRNIKGVIVHAWPEISKEEYITDASLPVIDLYSDMVVASKESGKPIVYDDGYHWNPLGHQVIAKGLVRELKKMDLFPG